MVKARPLLRLSAIYHLL